MHFTMVKSTENKTTKPSPVMTKEELKERSKQFALRIIKLVDSLPKTQAGRAIGNQIIRSGTSVGANYRSACRARSVADFVSKIAIVEEEADETIFRLELVSDSGMIKKGKLEGLMAEAKELTAIFTASGKTAKQKIRNKGNTEEKNSND